MRKLVSLIAAVVVSVGALTPVAQADDIFNGGRSSGGSSQLIPPGITGSELPEIDGSVDLTKYVGKWYQVAAVPQPYTLQCANNTTAEYKLVNDTTISVRNSCGTSLGQQSFIDGSATVRSKASLRVNFPGVPFQKEDGATNYRVTYLADNYSLAIVGSPNRSAGFVLSRTPQLSKEQWQMVRSTVESRGWWSCAFLTVPMAGGRGDAVPVCSL